MTYNLADNLIAFTTERRCTDAASPYDGFNITHYCGDADERVRSCRRQLGRQLGITEADIIVPRQVHGINVEEVSEQNRCQPFEECDALITQLNGVCIGISTADCVPLLFYDTRTKAIAAAHAGWRGTVAHIGMLTLRAMHEAYGTQAIDVRCIIGPSIGPAAFEVGQEVYDAFAEADFPMTDIARLEPETQRWHIDLWRANAWQLTQQGVPTDAIHISAICTYTHYDRFFSARRLGINSGRLFTGIMKQKR